MTPTQHLIIFDIDGTLLYSGALDSRCFADTYERRYGLPFPSIDWSQYPHVTDTVIFETVIQGHFQRLPTMEETAAFEAEYIGLLQAKRAAAPQLFREVAGARALVEKLAARGHSVAIGTGGWHKPALVKLRHIGLAPESLVISAADGQYSREAILQKAMHEAGHHTGRYGKVVYFGDALWDVQTTRNLGMDFVGVRYQGDHEVLRAAGATQVLTHFEDEEAVLAAIAQASPPR